MSLTKTQVCQFSKEYFCTCFVILPTAWEGLFPLSSANVNRDDEPILWVLLLLVIFTMPLNFKSLLARYKKAGYFYCFLGMDKKGKSRLLVPSMYLLLGHISCGLNHW